jgi:uncharacterized protein YkwD
VHHHPAGPPLSARMAGALTRSRVRTRRSARRRVGRIGLGMALSTAVTGFFLAVPVVSSGTGTSTMSLDSSSSSAARYADETSPVVMGRDGAPAPSSAAVVPVVPPVTEVPTTAPSAAAPAASEASSAAPETTTVAPAPSAAATSAGATAPGLEGEVLALVNTVRAGAGCAPLVHDEGLAGVARAHSADMRDRNFFDHTNLDGLDPFDRAEAAGQTNARAENIAAGQPDPAAVMDAWMNSSGHRANILDCGLRTLGVGVAEGPGGPWWTQLFGA